MGKLKNAFMEISNEDMRFGSQIEDYSTDALTLMLGMDDIDDNTKSRAETELIRRKTGQEIERITDMPDPDDIPHIDIVMYDFFRVTQFLEENPKQTKLYRHDIREYLQRIQNVLDNNHGN